MDQTAKSDPKVEQEREKHLRFEKVAETTTYLVVIGFFILTLLPFKLTFPRLILFILYGVLLTLAFVWFHFLPKKFVGPLKTFLYFLITIGFIYLGVHFTGGIRSFVIFVFYLSILRAAAYIELKSFIVLNVLISGLLLVEALFFSGTVPISEKLSLWSLQTWVLIAVAFFGRYVFDEEKRAEGAEESEKLKTVKQIDNVKNEFVYVISKKLKEPVGTLEGYLTTALSAAGNNLNVDLKSFLVKAEENTKRLSRLINDLSDISKIEQQTLSLDLTDVDINQVIGSTLSDFNISAAEKNIRLGYQRPLEIVIVRADYSRLHEILANLVDNAIKYSPNSSQIEVGFTHDQKNVMISVKDSGFGIPQESQVHLFEKFYRVEKNKGIKGTGLGLFVTRELVERQGGRIWFESKEGVGTTFHFTLPLVGVR